MHIVHKHVNIYLCSIPSCVLTCDMLTCNQFKGTGQANWRRPQGKEPEIRAEQDLESQGASTQKPPAACPTL